MTLQEIEEKLGYLINVLDRNKDIVKDINRALYSRSEILADETSKNPVETATEDGYLFRISNLLELAGNIADKEWGELTSLQNKLQRDPQGGCAVTSQY